MITEHINGKQFHNISRAWVHVKRETITQHKQGLDQHKKQLYGLLCHRLRTLSAYSHLAHFLQEPHGTRGLDRVDYSSYFVGVGYITIRAYMSQSISIFKETNHVKGTTTKRVKCNSSSLFPGVL